MVSESLIPKGSLRLQFKVFIQVEQLFILLLQKHILLNHADGMCCEGNENCPRKGMCLFLLMTQTRAFLFLSTKKATLNFMDIHARSPSNHILKLVFVALPPSTYTNIYHSSTMCTVKQSSMIMSNVSILYKMWNVYGEWQYASYFI